PLNLKSSLSTPSISSQPSTTPAELSNNPGFRAAEAFIRPSPIATMGNIVSYGFDFRNCLFNLQLTTNSPCSEDQVTEIFLPEYHFPSDRTTVEVSGGKWSISFDEDDGGLIQKLWWWH